MNHDHTVSGMRIMVMPLARISSVVVRKFNAPISDAMTENRNARDPQISPEFFTRPGRLAARSAADIPSTHAAARRLSRRTQQ